MTGSSHNVLKTDRDQPNTGPIGVTHQSDRPNPLQTLTGLTSLVHRFVDSVSMNTYVKQYIFKTHWHKVT
jgi:hypothetical protein